MSTVEILGKDLQLTMNTTVSTVGFASGGNEPDVGDKLYNDVGSPDHNWIVVEVEVTSGSWSGGDAAGTLTLRKFNDDTLGWSDTETINRESDDTTIATVDGSPTDGVSHSLDLEGVSSYGFDRDYTDTDTTTNDEDGDAASLPVKIGRTVAVEGKRKESSSGHLAPGQSLFKDLGDFAGHDAVNEFVFKTQNGSGASKTFDAWVELETELTAGHEEHATWSATLHVIGKPT